MAFNVNQFKCVASNDKHYAIKPVELPCGHFICKSCADNEIKNNRIKCFACQKIILIDNNNKCNESFTAKKSIKENLDELFSCIENEFTRSISNLNDLSGNVESIIENIRYEIEIRFESLRNQLDELNLQFQNRLDEIKIDINKYITSMRCSSSICCLNLKF